MALNLVRNSRVFFTTNVDANGKVAATGFLAANTYELQVLDGFTFSQTTGNDVVTIMEAGAAPVRGQRSFNTSLAPVDFSMSTYIRPKNVTGTPVKITAEESVLWNAIFSDTALSNVTTLTTVSTVAVSAAGVATITGTTMTSLPTVGDVITLSGIATTTPANNDKYVNGSGVVLTSTATSITVQLFSYMPVAITTTTLVTAATVKYTKAAWAESNASYSQVTSGPSDKHQLQKFGMIFLVDQVTYLVDNCALNQVSIDFGLDAIATAAWTGQGTTLRQLATVVTATSTTFGGTGLAGSFTSKVTDAQYITNKLSTASLTVINSLKDAGGGTIAAGGASPVTYIVPITGGNITVNNNITYITPANLGVVNSPVTYYTGARAITGTLNAYLRTGSTSDTGELLRDLLDTASVTIEPMFALSIALGGGNNTVKVLLDMSSAVVSIPTVDVAQVVSTAINFTAQGYVPSATDGANVFDLTKNNDIAVRYYA